MSYILDLTESYEEEQIKNELMELNVKDTTFAKFNKQSVIKGFFSLTPKIILYNQNVCNIKFKIFDTEENSKNPRIFINFGNSKTIDDNLKNLNMIFKDIVMPNTSGINNGFVNIIYENQNFGNHLKTKLKYHNDKCYLLKNNDKELTELSMKEVLEYNDFNFIGHVFCTIDKGFNLKTSAKNQSKRSLQVILEKIIITRKIDQHSQKQQPEVSKELVNMDFFHQKRKRHELEDNENEYDQPIKKKGKQTVEYVSSSSDDEGHDGSRVVGKKSISTSSFRFH